jgi:hypothetical protein
VAVKPRGPLPERLTCPLCTRRLDSGFKSRNPIYLPIGFGKGLWEARCGTYFAHRRCAEELQHRRQEQGLVPRERHDEIKARVWRSTAAARREHIPFPTERKELDRAVERDDRRRARQVARGRRGEGAGSRKVVTA